MLCTFNLLIFHDDSKTDKPLHPLDGVLHPFDGVAGRGSQAQPAVVLNVCRRTCGWHHGRGQPVALPFNSCTRVVDTVDSPGIARRLSGALMKKKTDSNIDCTRLSLHRLYHKHTWTLRAQVSADFQSESQEKTNHSVVEAQIQGPFFGTARKSAILAVVRDEHIAFFYTSFPHVLHYASTPSHGAYTKTSTFYAPLRTRQRYEAGAGVWLLPPPPPSHGP